jgi:hypothetical protein
VLKVKENFGVYSIFFLADSDFEQAKTIGTSLVFAVGNKEVPSFRMIERHYFRYR